MSKLCDGYGIHAPGPPMTIERVLWFPGRGSIPSTESTYWRSVPSHPSDVHVPQSTEIGGKNDMPCFQSVGRAANVVDPQGLYNMSYSEMQVMESTDNYQSPSISNELDGNLEFIIVLTSIISWSSSILQMIRFGVYSPSLNKPSILIIGLANRVRLRHCLTGMRRTWYCSLERICRCGTTSNND
jgi:hypothetical protein